jgi:hypothetical protein
MPLDLHISQTSLTSQSLFFCQRANLKLLFPVQGCLLAPYDCIDIVIKSHIFVPYSQVSGDSLMGMKDKDRPRQRGATFPLTKKCGRHKI